MHLARSAGTALALLALFAGGACSSDDGSSAPPTTAAPASTSTTTSVGATGTLQFRPVLALLPPGADSPLGPALANGVDLIESATASISQQGNWVVSPVLTDDGIGAFNEMAAQCFALAASCPTGQIAVVVDGVVISAPSIQTDSFEADQIQISADFSEDAARELADSLDRGAS